MLLAICLLMLLCLILGLTFVEAPPKTTMAAIVQGTLTLLAMLGWPLLMHGMTSVADAYEECVDWLLNDLLLINLADKVFPGQGITFLQTLLSLQFVVGFKLRRI